MKRKNYVTTNLRNFLARVAAKKRQTDSERDAVSVTSPSSNESQMQIVVFQWQS